MVEGTTEKMSCCVKNKKRKNIKKVQVKLKKTMIFVFQIIVLFQIVEEMKTLFQNE